MLRLALSILQAAVPLTAAAQQPAEVGDAASGRIFAEEVCAECHAVERGEGLMEDPPPLPFEPGVALAFEDIANTPGVNARALIVWLTSTHPNMPNLILDEEALRDVTAYILSLKDGR